MGSVESRNRENAGQESGLEPAYLRKVFWDYRQCQRLEDIPGPIRAQRYVDYWPEFHCDYKAGKIDIQDIKNIVKTIIEFGPVKYSEPVREYVIKTLIIRWFNESNIRRPPK